MEKIKARLHGGVNAPGRVVKFEIVDRVPAGAEPVKLDPEQRVGYPDDDNQWKYEFYMTTDGDYVAVERETEMENELKMFSGVCEVTRYGYFNVEAHDYDEAQRVLEDGVAHMDEMKLPNKESRIEIIEEMEHAENVEADFSSEKTVIHVHTKPAEDKQNPIDFKPLSQQEWELYWKLHDRVLMEDINFEVKSMNEDAPLPMNAEEWPDIINDIFTKYKEDDWTGESASIWGNPLRGIIAATLEDYGYEFDWFREEWVEGEA